VTAVTAEAQRSGRIASNKKPQLFLLALGFFFTMAGLLAAASDEV
jgi:hypothetical protein